MVKAALKLQSRVSVWAGLLFVAQTLQHCTARSKKVIVQRVLFLLAIPCSAKVLNKHIGERETLVQEVLNIYPHCFSLHNYYCNSLGEEQSAKWFGGNGR